MYGGSGYIVQVVQYKVQYTLVFVNPQYYYQLNIQQYDVLWSAMVHIAMCTAGSTEEHYSSDHW